MDKETNRNLNLFDVMVLFARWIGKMCNRLWLLLGQAARLCYRQWWIALLGIIIGLAWGLYKSRPSHQYYKAEAMAIINGPSPLMIRQALQAAMIPTSPKVSKTHTLATTLGIPDSVAASVRSITCYDVIDCLNDGVPDYIDYSGAASKSDTLNVLSDKYVQLRIMTYRPELLPVVEDALLLYVNSRPAVVDNYQHYCRSAEELYQSVSHQIVYLDSLSRRLYVEEPVERTINLEYNKVVVGDGVCMVSPDLTRERMQLSEAMTLSSNLQAPVVLVDRFSVYNKPVNSRAKTCLPRVLLCFVIALFVAALWERRKEILNFLRTR